eukprot:6208750-Pleurochrysis_carterae.AAC.1
MMVPRFRASGAFGHQFGKFLGALGHTGHNESYELRPNIRALTFVEPRHLKLRIYSKCQVEASISSVLAIRNLQELAHHFGTISSASYDDVISVRQA